MLNNILLYVNLDQTDYMEDPSEPGFFDLLGKLCDGVSYIFIVIFWVVLAIIIISLVISKIKDFFDN